MEPINYTQLFELEIFPLCVWREVRNQSWLARRGVAHVIKNRVHKNDREFGGGTYHSVILKPWAFSSFNHNDPNVGKWPIRDGGADWKAWLDIQTICFDVYHALNIEGTDPTDGALFFWTPPLTSVPHAFGNVRETLQAGEVHFCKPCPMTDIRDATTMAN